MSERDRSRRSADQRLRELRPRLSAQLVGRLEARVNALRPQFRGYDRTLLDSARDVLGDPFEKLGPRAERTLVGSGGERRLTRWESEDFDRAAYALALEREAGTTWARSSEQTPKAVKMAAMLEGHRELLGDARCRQLTMRAETMVGAIASADAQTVDRLLGELGSPLETLDVDQVRASRDFRGREHARNSVEHEWKATVLERSGHDVRLAAQYHDAAASQRAAAAWLLDPAASSEVEYLDSWMQEHGSATAMWLAANTASLARSQAQAQAQVRPEAAIAGEGPAFEPLAGDLPAAREASGAWAAPQERLPAPAPAAELEAGAPAEIDQAPDIGF
ncbi:hypothetical protein VSS74_24630 [Conexibacter stalactiti]|uniref:DUF222 domain-containing protein n=1 Tax=Conexibacter stalactiti TaxID=1940611 RepID=A0ABU4HZR4_9ACTN|nr:hypothetical protein [Conexibacter stalactiti]MDW5597559.1 hypothetical protein [Conexibacter stalactiti]MEC5038201.1 hypothetical protein [Conexibacter stalactiti]